MLTSHDVTSMAAPAPPAAVSVQQQRTEIWYAVASWHVAAAPSESRRREARRIERPTAAAEATEVRTAAQMERLAELDPQTGGWLSARREGHAPRRPRRAIRPAE